MEHTRKRLKRVVVLGSLLAVGCGGEQTGPSIAVLHSALGVPTDGFPNWEERVILVLTNRARSDPAAEVAAVCPTCTAYAPSKPLEYGFNHGRAARFQATSLLLAKSGLMHESVCTLVADLGSIYPDTCDGSPSCACEGGTASCACSGGKPYCTAPDGLTSWSKRIALFGASAAGENAAAGNSDPVSTFKQWVMSSGHWSNVNKASHGVLGTGHYTGSGGCWKDFWVQVFGSASATQQVLVGGAHYPMSGSTATQFKLWANYFDDGAPKLATVNIDGTCHPMTLERGSDTNGTYLSQQVIGSAGCHRYYFRFRDASGAPVSYPSAGSFGVGVGTTSCADYSASTRPTVGPGCGCFNDGECADTNPCTTDTCANDTCQHTPIAGCCTADNQCADANPCTTDTCAGNKCQHTPIAGCCTTDSACADDNPCTTDSCVANACQHDPVAGCCTTDSPCVDEDPCTADSCVDNACQHDPIAGCCAADADCDDGTACTTDSCAANACQHDPIAGCCKADTDCADNDPCTQESCELPGGSCAISPIAGCCTTDADCNGGETDDPCAPGSCDLASHTCQPPPGCETGGPNGEDPQRELPGEAQSTLEAGCSMGPVADRRGPALLLVLVLLAIRPRRRAGGRYNSTRRSAYKART